MAKRYRIKAFGGGLSGEVAYRTKLDSARAKAASMLEPQYGTAHKKYIIEVQEFTQLHSTKWEIVECNYEPTP